MRKNSAQVSNRKHQSFLQGALILTASMAIVKIIGAIFKLPLFGILGAEGYGYFTSAYDLYNPLFTLATAGFPIAISRMVSENIARKRYRDVRLIHKISLPIFTILGMAGFILMVIGTFIYANVINTPGVKFATLTLAPTILFACLMSIYRGYYEGLRNMYPTAISEVIEALSKLILGLTISNAIVSSAMQEYADNGTVMGVAYETSTAAKSAILPYAAAGAIVGITIGSILGFVFLLITYKRKGDGISLNELRNAPKSRPPQYLTKTLIRIAIPVALGALVMNVASFIDSILIQRRLYDIMQSESSRVLMASYSDLITMEAVTNNKVHTILYGCYGAAATVMMLVPAVTQTFGISALPSVTTAWTEGIHKKIKKSIESVMRITTMVTIPAGLMLATMSYPIMQLLYINATDGEVKVAASVLTTLGIATIFISTSTPLCSMLQAVKRVDLPVKLLSIGVVIKVVLNYILVGIPSINIHGAGVGTLVCYIFITVAAFFFLCRETHIVPNLVSILIKPLLASIGAVIVTYLLDIMLNNILPDAVSTVFSLIVGGVLYILLLFALKTVSKSDILSLPKGKIILRLLRKMKLMR